MTCFSTTTSQRSQPTLVRGASTLAVAVILLMAARSDAQPTITGYGHLTDRFGPHAIPLLPVGDKVQVGVFLDTVDSVASPTISVQLVQGDTTLELEALPPGHPLYEGEHLYYRFIDFDPQLAGPWNIIATDSTGTASGVSTNAIDAPEFLPFVENVSVDGTSQNARVSWSMPSLAGHDVDGVAVRVIEAVSGHHVWQSDLYDLQTTSVVAPAGILEQGVAYVFWVNLVDVEADYLENSSKVFSAPFRLTVTGDYNQNGTVDAADYTVWRDNLGGGALVNRGVGITGPVGDADYQIWKANFGQSLGPGSTAPAVPEPATCLLCILALGGCQTRRQRR